MTFRHQINVQALANYGFTLPVNGRDPVLSIVSIDGTRVLFSSAPEFHQIIAACIAPEAGGD